LNKNSKSYPLAHCFSQMGEYYGFRSANIESRKQRINVDRLVGWRWKLNLESMLWFLFMYF